MADVESLVNKGYLVLNRDIEPPPEKTAVVLGVARGGTTMVAAVLQALGVPMGERLGPVLEDVALSEAIEGKDGKRVAEITADRNRRFAIWGWKRPAAVHSARVWGRRLRNPHVIAIYRDPFAIANRNRISMLGDTVQGLKRANRELAQLTEFVAETDLPTLVCSYEKALTNPDGFIAAVDDFLQLDASDRWDRARSAIGVSETYLRSSRITDAAGYVDLVTADCCAGWAFYRHKPERKARVHVHLNGRLVGSTEASYHRHDVRDAGFHPTGTCGFWFHWPADTRPHDGDQVEVWVEGDIAPLRGTRSLSA